MPKVKKFGPRIGAHKSIAGGIDKAIDRGLESTCESLQIFTRPPRRWAPGKSSLSEKMVQPFLMKSKNANYYDTAIHMPYLPNLATPDNELHEKSTLTLIEELERADKLKIPYIVSHLGSPKHESRVFAVKRVSEAINESLNTVKTKGTILLENSTAKKKPWGKYFEDIFDVISLIDNHQRMGLCFDTAHAYSSGYDISTPEGLHEVFDHIEDLIGNNKIHLIHLNDSKGPLNSGIDHHEHIGKGYIGIDCFRELMQHARFKQISMILETPKESSESDKLNLNLLRSLRK
jgi:deoxyribonuclease-4